MHRVACIVTNDADAVYAHVQVTGDIFLRPIPDLECGSREVVVKDPKGHLWSVRTYDLWKAHG